ncbi:MAG: tripartite tricarboxylate transporter substrate binding protein [Burkholderiales bacterium]|nr:tripartite tricarboxylate transporter substrate binding protein [Burkholderiales bacterium]
MPSRLPRNSRPLARLLLAIALGATACAAAAQGVALVPPITLLVPYPAGGPSDLTARTLAAPVARELGLDVIVDNIAGASGAIAVQKVLNAPADGRLVYQGSQSELIIPPLTMRTIKYRPTDMEIVHPTTITPLLLVVRSELPAGSLQDFVSLARQRSASQPLSYGSSGVGSLYHLVPEGMAKLIGARFNHIPYKGAVQLTQDLVGDRLDFAVLALTGTVLQALRAGQYKALANMSRYKPRDLAHLPSISDLEAFRTIDFSTNSAYFVKKGTPSAIRSQLNKAIGSALATPPVLQALEGDGRRLQRGLTLAESEAFYAAEIAKYERIVAQIGFQPLD